MGRVVSRVTRALMLALLAGTGTAQAQNLLTIDDARLVENSSGPWVAVILVRLPSAPAAPVTVNYTTVAGSATPGSDYTTVSGMLTFSTSDSTKAISVQIFGDTSNEWSPTLKLDEVFHIELSNPSANATIQKGRSTVTLIDDDRVRPALQFVTALSGGTISQGMNRLHWRIPGAQTPVTDVTVAWKVGPACTFPTATTDTAGGGSFNLGSAPGAGATQTWLHAPAPAPNTTYCYSVFAIYSGTPVTGLEIANIKAKTFDATGPIAWRYNSGSASVVPPTVGADAIYTVDNVGAVHAMSRGASGGQWPLSWNPVAVGAPTQHRSAVIPTNGGRLLLGTDGGGVHAVDARFGHLVWSRSANFGTALPNVGGVQAPPAALLKAYGGNNDMILVGTNTVTTNKFFALDPLNGGTLGPEYLHAQMGSVNGMAVVDYPGNRVLFLTNASSATLYSLDMGPLGTPLLSPAALPAINPHAFTGSNGSPVMRGSRVIFGDTASQVYALDIVSGAAHSVPTGDGAVKGFLWPDRRDDRLYFATNTKIQAIRDTGAALSPLWFVSCTSPSMVLQKPGTDYIYVGNGNGELVQINVATQALVTLLLEGPGVQIGAPSLDGPNNLLIVGSSTGLIHAVRVAVPLI